MLKSKIRVRSRSRNESGVAALGAAYVGRTTNAVMRNNDID